jgi:hypothetical protein
MASHDLHPIDSNGCWHFPVVSNTELHKHLPITRGVESFSTSHDLAHHPAPAHPGCDQRTIAFKPPEKRQIRTIQFKKLLVEPGGYLWDDLWGHFFSA